MSDSQIINILTNNSDYFNIADIISNIFRWLLWIIIKVLCIISDGVENVLNEIYTLNNFFSSPQVEKIINLFKPVMWAILTISILYIGYQLVMNRDFKGEKIFQNFMLSMMVIMLLPTLMIKLNEITTEGVKSLNSLGGNTSSYISSAREILKDNLYDLKYLESNNFSVGDKTNNISTDNILKINVNQTIDRSFLGNEIFDKKIEIDENGKEEVVKLDKSFFGFISEEYYRYNFNFLNLIIVLLCIILTLVLTCIKISRIIIELAFNKIFAMLYAFADISEGQKLRAILKHILSMFAIIFSTALLLKIYMLVTTWINNLNSSSNIINIIFIIGASMMVIDAPNIIERILGIDAGIKSGWGLIVGGYSAMKTASELAKTTGNMIGSTANTLIGATSGLKGVADGFNNPTLEEERMSSSLGNNENNNSNSSNISNSNDVESNTNGSYLSQNQSNDNLSPNNEGYNNSDLDGNYGEDINNGISDNIISSVYGEHNSLSDDINTNIGMNDTSSLNNDLGQDSINGYDSQVENEKGISSLSDDINTNIGMNDTSSLNSDLGQDSIESSNISKEDKSENLSASLNNGDKTNTRKYPSRDNIQNPRETRTIGEYARDKITNSKPFETSRKSYNIGLNTGSKLRETMNKKRK